MHCEGIWTHRCAVSSAATVRRFAARARPCRLLLAGALAGAVGCAPPLETVSFPTSDAVFANPERGFYRPADTHSGRYRRLDETRLRAAREQEHITLVYRGFVLDDFVDAPISDAYLRAVERDFGVLRQAGMKAIVRFAYTNRVRTAPGTDWPPVQPYGDAALPRVLEHIGQLEPLLRANADVIAVVQAGLVGIWGEWFYTDHYAGDDLDEPGPDHWQARRQLVERLLTALPEDIPVQVRTPLQKRRLTESAEPLAADEAFATTMRARLGHHNDCFLASDTDYGTYRDTTADFAYLEADTRFVPVGGETCNPHPPRSECGNAVGEMARFHWTYLNSGYHRRVLGSWVEDGCMAEVQRRLGYRLRVTQARHAPQASPGGTWRLEMGWVNDGFAAPFRRRPVAVVLRHRGKGPSFRAGLDVDLRRLLPGETLVVEQRLGLPADMPTGTYGVYLHLSDPDPGLAPRPEYAVRLAMAGAWEQDSGYNGLGFEIEVVPGRSWFPERVDGRFRPAP